MNNSNAAKGIIEHQGRYLLIRRQSDDTESPRGWEIPGGRLDSGEDPVKGLKREIREETGLEAEVIHPVNVRHFTRKDGQVITMIIYFCRSDRDEVKISHEHEDNMWVDMKDLKRIIIPHFLEDIEFFERMKKTGFIE